MIEKRIIPSGWCDTLKNIDPGPFVTKTHPNLLCFKSEYHNKDNTVMAFNSAGEFFVTGDDTIVIPVFMECEDD